MISPPLDVYTHNAIAPSYTQMIWFTVDIYMLNGRSTFTDDLLYIIAWTWLLLECDEISALTMSTMKVSKVMSDRLMTCHHLYPVDFM